MQIDLDRFWAKVDRSGPTQPRMLSECWIWTAATSGGYGIFRISRLTRRAHRISWEIANGEIPDGLLVCHRCDTPSCVRPDHLFLGTNADNMRDRDLKGRVNAGETHPNAKLTLADVDLIRSSPERHAALAARFSVSRKTIWDIQLGRKWTSAQNRIGGSP